MAIRTSIPGEWLRQSAVVVYTLRVDGHCCDFVTANVTALTGWTVAEAIAPNWWQERLHPDDRERVLARQPALSSGELASDDYRFRHRDGHYLWLRDQRRLIEGGGEAERILGTWSDITELVAANARLQKSEARYRQLFEDNPQPMWVYDVETLRFLAVNDAAIATYGYSREEFLELTIRAIRPDEEQARLSAHLTATADPTGLVYAGEWRHRHKDGTAFEVEITSHAIRFEGRAAKMVVARDLSERKRAERALRASETELRRAQRIANLGSWRWHLASGSVEWSEQLYSIFGVDPANFSGDESAILATLVHRDDRAAMELFAAEVKRHGHAPQQQFRIVRPDGGVRVVWAEIGDAERDARGRPVVVTGVIQDVTDRAQAESERALLAAAVEQAGEAIVVTDAAGTIQYVNPAFEAVTGYSRAEAVGQNPRMLSSGRQPRELYEELWATITSGATWRGRLINRRQDGSLFSEDAAISPVLDASGEIVHYVAVKRDVTVELQLESQLRQAQRLEAIGSLAGGIAHDFNNMLSVIQGNAELALLEVRDDDSVRERLAEIVRAAERSAQLTRQLLGFARKQAVSPRALDLNETVESLLKMMRRLIGENIELTWQPAPGLWQVWIDPAQIDQILANLCVNARDAIAGVGRLTVASSNRVVGAADDDELTPLPPGEYVRLTVSDSGSGMDTATLERIFEPFFTTKEVGRGTGLGLATVYGIVQQNGGTIAVDSQLGSGTTFVIDLPRHRGTPGGAAAAVVEPRSAGSGESVLVVEDEPALLRAIEMMLRRSGYEALPANGPEEAIAIAAAHPARIDLLLTDIVMPGMSGYQLAERLLAQRPETKCLFMSGYTAGAPVPHGHPEAMRQFIQKPFSARELGARLRELLAAG